MTGPSARAARAALLAGALALAGLAAAPAPASAPATCLGVPRPRHLGIPGAWACTPSGWRWAVETPGRRP